MSFDPALIPWQTIIRPWNGVALRYREHVNTTEISYTGMAWRLRRAFDVEWENRFDFIKCMLGYSEVVGQRGAQYIHRVPPQPYRDAVSPFLFPVYEDKGLYDYFLYATSVENVEGVAPQGLSNDLTGTYTLARVTIGYESLTYAPIDDPSVTSLAWLDREGYSYIGYFDFYDHPADVGHAAANPNLPCYIGRYVTRQWTPSASYLVLPLGKYYYVNVPGTVPAATGGGKIVPTMEIVYTWHQIPSGTSYTSNQVKSILRYVGCVNRYTFDHCPPGTLLLTGVSSKPYKMTNGGFAHDIVLNMRYRNQLDINGNEISRTSGVPGEPTFVVNEAAGHNWFLQFVSDGRYEYTKVASKVNNTTGAIELNARTPFDYVDFRKIFDINNP